MIFDYKKYKTGTKLYELEDDLFWVLEQMPGLIRAEDLTQVPRKQDYCGSYNIPYIKDVYTISGNEHLV
jgi:hypothetical protein